MFRSRVDPISSGNENKRSQFQSLQVKWRYANTSLIISHICLKGLCIKGSPALRSHSVAFFATNYSANEPILRDHLPYVASFCVSPGMTP